MTKPKSYPTPRIPITLTQDSAGVWHVQAGAGKSFPASLYEVRLWLELVEVKATLAALTEYAARLTAGDPA